MDTIKFEVITPNGKRINGEPDLVVYLNGEDVVTMEKFKGHNIHTNVPSFLFNEWMWLESFDDSVFDGTRLIGVCGCGHQGCEDLIAKITTDEAVTTWTVYNDLVEELTQDFVFDKNDYEKQINDLKKQYFSYVWENREHRLTRLCTEFIRAYTTMDDIPIEVVEINKNDNILKLCYTNGFVPAGDGFARNTEVLEVKWDGKTTKDALRQLKKYANANLKKNTMAVNLRKEPFPLLWTRDKSMIGLEGDQNDD
jgi:hypothetical protein